MTILGVRTPDIVSPPVPCNGLRLRSLHFTCLGSIPIHSLLFPSVALSTEGNIFYIVVFSGMPSPMSRRGEYHKLKRVLQSSRGMRCEAVLLCALISIGRWGKPVLLRAWISIASYLSLRRKEGETIAAYGTRFVVCNLWACHLTGGTPFALRLNALLLSHAATVSFSVRNSQ